MSVEGRTWRWQAGRLMVEAHAHADNSVEVWLPWPLRSATEAPPFAEVRSADSASEERLRFVVRSMQELELVLGVIEYERAG